MSGINGCPYSTPCGYCTKWDKTCDCKVPDVKELKASESKITQDIFKPVLLMSTELRL